MATQEAAWLAHNQNNFLAVAFHKLNFIKEESRSEPAIMSKIGDLERVLEDMTLANRAVMASFRDSQVRASLDIGEIILHTAEQVRTLCRHSVAIDVLQVLGEIPVPFLSTHFHQVLFNVMKNASEAVPAENGRIFVEAGFEVRGRVDPRRGSQRSLHISVDDNGPGIPPNLQRSLLHGPFSTKPNGHGLGLSHARKTLDLYGGTLRFEPKEGPGARAHIIWPL